MKTTPKVLTQYCIKGRFFNEVMKLPSEVKIQEIAFECGFAIKRMIQPITTTLKGCGVTSLRKVDPSIEVGGLLTGSRAKMKRDIKTICDTLGLHSNTGVRVRRMVVSVGKNDKHVGTFVNMQKLLPTGDDGKLKRLPVLGLIKWTDEKAIASACNANTFKCRYDTQLIRTVLCEEG